MQREVSFDVSKEDADVIHQIAARATRLARSHNVRLVDWAVAMDLTAVHANGCPLRLADLLAADEFNLMHDVLGINQRLDRDTGQLGGCFLPRYHAKRRAA